MCQEDFLLVPHFRIAPGALRMTHVAQTYGFDDAVAAQVKRLLDDYFAARGGNGKRTLAQAMAALNGHKIENVRRQIQKWYGGAPIMEPNVRLLAKAAGASPEPILDAMRACAARARVRQLEERLAAARIVAEDAEAQSRQRG